MTDEFWQFVCDNRTADPAALRLRYAGKLDAKVDFSLAITQIECRRKFGKKIAKTLSDADNRFLFPSTLAGEQSTSDALAQWHTGLVEADVTLTDMTAGLGIDCLHLARKAREVVAVERNPLLVDALMYNAEQCRVDNLTVVNGDSIALLESGELRSDVVFIDPARRSASGGRVFAVSDCEPNIIALLPFMRQYFNIMIAKLSPMLDISEVCRSLPGITDIYAVGTTNECKEVVARVDLSKSEEEEAVLIHAVTVSSDAEYNDICFTAAEESTIETHRVCPAVGDYLYEPAPAIMKAGAFNVFAQRFGLDKISDNTHIYICKERKDGVPASMYMIEEIIPWQSKNLKRLNSRYPVGEVAVRNFGMTADALRKKLGVRNGDGVRILGVTDAQSVRSLLVLKRV